MKCYMQTCLYIYRTAYLYTKNSLLYHITVIRHILKKMKEKIYIQETGERYVRYRGQQDSILLFLQQSLNISTIPHVDILA